MTWNSGLSKLQEILSELFPEAHRSREVVVKANVPTGRIDFEVASLDRWRNILEEAHKRRQVQAIVAAAGQEYESRKDELAAAEQQYLEELSQKEDKPKPAPDPRQRFSSFRQKSNLVDALLACPTISNRHTRDTVVENLSSDVKNNIQRSSADRVDVMNMVTTVLNYEDGLEELVEVVRAFEGNSVPMQNLDELLA